MIALLCSTGFRRLATILWRERGRHARRLRRPSPAAGHHHL